MRPALTESVFEGYKRLDFTLDNHPALLICPQTAAPGKPWVWRAEFFDIFASADRALLAEGWHIAYLLQPDLFGAPKAVARMKKLHALLTEEFRLSPKADLFGFSRGGLYATNYAICYPQDVSVLYLDAPVLSIKNWPMGTPPNHYEPTEWEKCKLAYGVTEESIQGFHDDPLDKLHALIIAQVPLMLVAGLKDTTVLYEYNAAVIAALYEAHGMPYSIVLKPACDHWPHSLPNPAPIVSFIKERRGLGFSFRDNKGSIAFSDVK